MNFIFCFDNDTMAASSDPKQAAPTRFLFSKYRVSILHMFVEIQNTFSFIFPPKQTPLHSDDEPELLAVPE